jgi:hypothetical protein
MNLGLVFFGPSEGGNELKGMQVIYRVEDVTLFQNLRKNTRAYDTAFAQLSRSMNPDMANSVFSFVPGAPRRRAAQTARRPRSSPPTQQQQAAVTTTPHDQQPQEEVVGGRRRISSIPSRRWKKRRVAIQQQRRGTLRKRRERD